MGRGIIIFGAPGSGTTTIGKEVAKQLGFQHFDLDDYIWRFDTKIPYTISTPCEERIQLLMNDISKFPHFVMSGSMDSFNAPFVSLFDLAVYNTAPVEIRAERFRTRELARWGDRVLPGGDMYEALHQGDYLAIARQYEISGPPYANRKMHEQWAAILPCSVLSIDGTLPVAENVALIIDQYKPKLPLDLAAILDGYVCIKNLVGCSSAEVYRYHNENGNLFLKITRADDETQREHDLLLWLDGKLPVPEVKYWYKQDGLAYLLMNRIL